MPQDERIDIVINAAVANSFRPQQEDERMATHEPSEEEQRLTRHIEKAKARISEMKERGEDPSVFETELKQFEADLKEAKKAPSQEKAAPSSGQATP